MDPTLKKLTFTYTDTDSMQIFGEYYFKLKELGYIKSKSESKLGFLCSDIDDEGIIIYEKNLAPKTYKYEYINNKNEIKIKDDCIMKCKGIPKKCLKSDFYESESPVEVEFDGLKRKHKSLTKDDKSKGITHFSIVNNHQKRTINKTDWQGMNLKQQYFPHGFTNI